jgi:hypothetical protein
MKIILILCLSLISQIISSQDLSKEERQSILDSREKTSIEDNKSKYRSDSYRASNGILYKVGDTITLGRGSAPNGYFNYLEMRGFSKSLSALSGYYDNITRSIGRNYSGLNIVIKKIIYSKFKGSTKVVFVVGGGNITNYNLMIEDAIATCEIIDCKELNNTQVIYQKQEDKYDKLKKVKELLDNGTLTQEEFEIEKKKILNN